MTPDELAAPQPGRAVDNLDARDSDRGAVEVGDDEPSGPRGDRIAVGRYPRAAGQEQVLLPAVENAALVPS